MSKVKLKNCPFCNSRAEEEHDYEYLEMLELERAVFCTGTCPIARVRIDINMWQNRDKGNNTENPSNEAIISKLFDIQNLLIIANDELQSKIQQKRKMDWFKDTRRLNKAIIEINLLRTQITKY